MRAYMEAVFEKLIQAGWITSYAFKTTTNRYVFKWTPKGRERSRWVNLIGDELNLGPKGLTTLLTICHEHAPHE